MATTKRRIQITLEPELDSVVSRISELSGSPVSKVCAELLMNSLPVLSQFAEVLELSKQKQTIDVQALKKLVDEGQSMMDQIHSDMKNIQE